MANSRQEQNLRMFMAPRSRPSHDYTAVLVPLKIEGLEFSHQL
jgi:hypothetical protein